MRAPGELVDGQVDFGEGPERLKELLELVLSHGVRQVPGHGVRKTCYALKLEPQKR